jgi:hypothetical protein
VGEHVDSGLLDGEPVQLRVTTVDQDQRVSVAVSIDETEPDGG